MPAARVESVEIERHLVEAERFTEAVIESERLDRACEVVVLGVSATDTALRMSLTRRARAAS